MIEAGLWKAGSRKLDEVHCWRPRRVGFGELVQWDTSEHDWLEGRGPVRYLVRMIDDGKRQRCGSRNIIVTANQAISTDPGLFAIRRWSGIPRKDRRAAGMRRLRPAWYAT